MIVTMDPTDPPKLTPEQLALLKEAETQPITFDDDCPEFSDEELKLFRRISDDHRTLRQKQTVTLRLSPQAVKKARSLGKGYTSVLSRILENALNNPDIVKRYL